MTTTRKVPGEPITVGGDTTTTAPPAPSVHPSLAAALVAFQAQIPRIAKGETATVTGETKDGRPVKYSYSYADLGEMSQVVLPLLAACGLSFTSRPTFSEQRDFVLKYSLLHVSGEREDGEYALPDPLRTKPQTLGGAITYAKRYCLSAITGVAPLGEDDDGQAAQQEGVMAGSRQNPFDAPLGDDQPTRQAQRLKATPADDQWQTPAPEGRPARGGHKPTEDVQLPPETDQDWYKRIIEEAAQFTTDSERDALLRRAYEKHAAGGCTKDDGRAIKAVIAEREKELRAKAPAEQWPDGSAGEAAQEMKP